MVEWEGPDSDGDWELKVDRLYEGLLCNRFTGDGTWRFCYRSHPPKHLNTTDLEEAKNIAFALWALNQ